MFEERLKDFRGGNSIKTFLFLSCREIDRSELFSGAETAEPFILKMHWNIESLLEILAEFQDEPGLRPCRVIHIQRKPYYYGSDIFPFNEVGDALHEIFVSLDHIQR